MNFELKIMSIAALRLQSRKLQSKISSVSYVRIPWKLLYVTAGIFSLVLLFFYITTVDQLTKETFLIKNDSAQADALDQQNKVLEASFAQSSFLGTVQDRATSLSFVKISNVVYVPLYQNALAQAR